jgi:hypothetical protein
MRLTVFDDNRNSIRAHLFTYDAAGDEIGEEIIPVGGVDISELPNAAMFVLTADGFQDAHLSDLYNHEYVTWQLVPAYQWALPALAAAAVVYILSRYFKF